MDDVAYLLRDFCYNAYHPTAIRIDGRRAVKRSPRAVRSIQLNVAGGPTLIPPDRPRRLALAACLALTVTAVVAGCAMTGPPPRPPEPLGPASSAIGVHITVKSVIGTKELARRVLFVRMSSEAPPYTEPSRLAYANYRNGSSAFLLDPEPGTYAIVVLGVSSPWMNAGVYLAESVVARSIVRVQPGKFAYAGDFRIDALRGFGDTDDTQRYYYNFFRDGLHNNPALWAAGLIGGGWPPVPVRGVLLDAADPPLLDRAAFIAHNRAAFAGTGWAPLLDGGGSN